jgi:hypothetical protein
MQYLSPIYFVTQLKMYNMYQMLYNHSQYLLM